MFSPSSTWIQPMMETITVAWRQTALQTLRGSAKVFGFLSSVSLAFFRIHRTQEPMSRSMQLNYIPFTAFSKTDLFLDRIYFEWDSHGSGNGGRWKSLRTGVEWKGSHAFRHLFFRTSVCFAIAPYTWLTFLATNSHDVACFIPTLIQKL